MQSIRLLVFVLIGTVILGGALLMIGCNSSGGTDTGYSLDCIFTNVQNIPQCDSLASRNYCQNPSTYDPKSNTCYTNACYSCSK